MRVSVVIPTLNEENYILECLKSIENQSIKPFEIIVSDGNSEDRTIEIVKNFSRKCKIPIRIVISKKRAASIQRQRGAEIARGDIIAFIDADSTAERDWIKKILEGFEDSRVVGVYGKAIASDPYRSLSEFLNLYMALTSYIFPSPSGMNIAVRRDVFRKENFDERFVTCEEIDLFRRLKTHGRIKFINSTVFTSSRRIKKWGFMRFLIFHTLNTVRYNIAKQPFSKY
jgi:glycosyltransferase involved in cell wall biosynthesis